MEVSKPSNKWQANLVSVESLSIYCIRFSKIIKRRYPHYKPTQLHYKTPNYLVSPASNNSIYDIGIHDNPEMESLILSETMEDSGRLKNFELSQFPVSSLVRKRLENTITIR